MVVMLHDVVDQNYLVSTSKYVYSQEPAYPICLLIIMSTIMPYLVLFCLKLWQLLLFE